MEIISVTLALEMRRMMIDCWREIQIGHTKWLDLIDDNERAKCRQDDDAENRHHLHHRRREIVPNNIGPLLIDDDHDDAQINKR